MACDDYFAMGKYSLVIPQDSDEIKCACLAQVAARCYRHVQHAKLLDCGVKGGYSEWIINGAQFLIKYIIDAEALHAEIIQARPSGASVDGYLYLVLTTDPLLMFQ
jgi:hypothetical protein